MFADDELSDVETSSTRDMTSAHVGIVHATDIEIAPLMKLCDRRRRYEHAKYVFTGGFFGHMRIAFARCGMGRKGAADATRLLIDGHRPKLILSVGFAGGLRDDVKRFDFVHPDTLVTEDAEPVAIAPSLPPSESPRIHVGRLLTVDRIVRTAAEKRELGSRFGALAVDMETAAVRQEAHAAKVPFVGLRIISDDVSTELPPEVLSVVGSTGALRLGAALASVWKRPSSVKEMWSLRESAQESADRLCKMLASMLEQIPVDD
jgi:adenosylhomocysteine nucleosidase